MLDLSDIPRPQGADVQIFYGNVTTANAVGGTWVKPRGVSFVHIFALGGGGGGGGGANTGSNGGGGGGGSAAQCSMLYFANDIPDTLYLSVGKGGAGGAANSNGTAGIITRVSIWPEALANSTLAVSNAGQLGQAGTVGTGGTAGATSAITSMALAGLGFTTYGMAAANNCSIAGAAGGYGNLRLTTTAASGTGTAATLTFTSTGIPQYAAGDTITVAGVTPTGYNGTFIVTSCTNTTVTYPNATTGSQTVAGTIAGQSTPMFPPTTGLMLTGGGGGGQSGTSISIAGVNGTDTRFFPLTLTTPTLTSPVIVSGGIGNISPSSPPNGGNGVRVPGTLVFLGGAGGGGVFQQFAGAGGKGSYGCGGGGGGGASGSGTPGAGGDGGDGLVIITAW